MAKTTCEESKRLNIFWMRKQGYFCGWHSGTIHWNRNGEPSGNISITVDASDTSPYVRLNYTWSDYWSDAKEDMDYKIRLVTTCCFLGGKRYWFICPLIKNGVACERRVGILYGCGKWFGCRNCLNLAYQSQLENHGNSFFGAFGEYLRLDRLVEERLEKVRVKYWRGQPTKRHARLLRKTERLDNMDWSSMETEMHRRLNGMR